jgi:ring-1,2-phenylacetyl-CoA epoxidase subunit PaaE
MGLFTKLFNQKQKLPRGFYSLEVASIKHHYGSTIEIGFVIKDEVRNAFNFEPGQYVNIDLEVNGEELRRSYSICSAPAEGLSIAVKTVSGGKVSNWLYSNAKVGMELIISAPEGRFVLPRTAQKVVAFAAGSGITPILSIAKSFRGEQFQLHYGNQKKNEILFKEELDKLDKVKTTYLVSREEAEGFVSGRIDKEYLSNLIRADLSLLKSDVFLVCGPEEMILNVKESLKVFGISEDKIIYELFTAPKLLVTETKESADAYKGKVDLSIQLDGDVETIQVDEKTLVLDAALKSGLDVPYSCRGGVCSSCKCKIIEGSAKMRSNYILTDKEIEEGYLLSCQATATSASLKISYDV